MNGIQVALHPRSSLDLGGLEAHGAHLSQGRRLPVIAAPGSTDPERDVTPVSSSPACLACS